MTLFKKLYIVASSIPGFNLGLLICLMMLSFALGISLSCFDASTIRIYLEYTQKSSLAYNLLFVSILMFLTGYIYYLLERRRGYGAIMVLSVVVLGLAFILWGLESYDKDIFAQCLFVFKYIVFFLFPTSTFLIVSRFLALRRGSIKRVCMMGALFLGLAFGSFISLIFDFGAYTSLYLGYVLLICCLFSLFLLTRFVPVEKEVFVSKTGEVKDLSELKLVRSIYSFCFVFFAIKCIADFIFYSKLDATFDLFGVWKNMLYWWITLGITGFLTVFLLFRTRYFYMISGGMIVFLIGGFLLVISSTLNMFYLCFIGTILMVLSMFLYFDDFQNALLRILNQGLGQSIYKKRMVFIEPVGFMLGALCCVYFSKNIEPILFGFICFLFLVFLLSLKFYSVLLCHLLELRAWRGGPLLLINKKVLNYIHSQIVSENKNDVIYFLSMLGVSNKWMYSKWLLKLLKHENEKVRLFVLEKMMSFYDVSRFEKALEMVFLRDKSVKVKCRALSMLIQISYEEKGFNAVNGFLSYLDNAKLSPGAIGGFLKTGGAPALLATERLQKLVESKKVKDNLLALSIMDWAPSKTLVRLLIRLIKSNSSVVGSKALLVASKLTHPECLPIILTSLDDPLLRENALVALKSYGINAFPMIERALNNIDTPPVRLKTLILFLTMLPSGEGKQILLRSLQIGNQKLRKTIIQGMIDRGIFWIHKDKYKLLFEGIKKDVNRILWLSDLVKKYKQVSFPQTNEVFGFLIRAILEDIRETRETILYQLLLLKDNDLYVKAVRMLLSKKTSTHALALSSLQDMLPKKLYNLVKTSLQELEADKYEIINPEISRETVVEDVSKLLKDPPFIMPDWIKATALYCLRYLECPTALPVIRKCLKSKNPLVLEASIWAFCRIEKDERERHEVLLNVPTSQLVLQSLDTILEG